MSADVLVIERDAVVEVVEAARQGPPGPPGPPGGGGYLHSQASASAAWIVNHNLGVRPDIAVRDTGGNEVLAQITHTTLHQAVVSFATPVAGEARCI